MKIPRLSGKALAAVRAAAEAKGSGALLRSFVRASMGIDALFALPESARAKIPMDMRPFSARPLRRRPASGLSLPSPGGFPRTAEAYAAAYRAGSVGPEVVAERVLAGLSALAARRPTMNVLTENDPQRTLAEAKTSAERFARGAPKGPLDGVPFLVKDELDVARLSTRLGAAGDAPSPAERDATIVARLCRAGAVFAGKTVLTEWGMSPIGGNIHYAMPHNAHDSTRAPGGSSSGSAVGVALGLAPFAIGSDGGGSIRIPSALNGIFGIKPTFGRVSRAGDGFSGSSVAHAGPIGASTRDLVAFLDAVASEHDPDDPITAWAPPPPEGGFGVYLGAGVAGLVIGVPEAEIAEAEPEIGRAVEEALRALEKEGAILQRIDIPMAKHAPAIGYLIIGPESVAGNRDTWMNRRERIADDTRLSFAVIAGIPTVDQVDAERLRAGLRREMAAVLAKVDVLALPTTAITAPPYGEADERTCFADTEAVGKLCRYSFLGNLTGLPGATAPIGMDRRGLPIGLQIMGDAWDEPTVLSVLAHLERMGAAKVVRPAGAIDVLG